MATIDINGADAYFALGNHVQAQVWLKFDRVNRAGAVATAKRQFEMELGREMRPETDPERPRINEAFAVYEQALFLLNSSAFADARNGDGAVMKGRQGGKSASSGAAVVAGGRWSKDALRWLGAVRTEFVRG